MGTTENVIKFVVDCNGRPTQEIHKLSEIVYGSLTVRKPLSGSAAMINPGDGGPTTVNIFVTVLADDDDELVAAADAVSNALRNFEIETIGDPELRSSRPVLPPTVRTAGVTYDEATLALTIDTWAPSWKDLELTLAPVEDGRVIVIIADYEAGRRQEQGVEVKTITVRRPDGLPPTMQPPGLGSST